MKSEYDHSYFLYPRRGPSCFFFFFGGGVTSSFFVSSTSSLPFVSSRSLFGAEPTSGDFNGRPISKARRESTCRL